MLSLQEQYFVRLGSLEVKIGSLESEKSGPCRSILVLQLTASPSTTEASTSERSQFGAITNRKATSSIRDPSLTSVYYY